MIIAIDGPTGSGKSTVAKLVADNLHFHYLDTGSMYRAIGWMTLHNNADVANEAAVAHVANSAEIEFIYPDSDVQPARVVINGHDVTDSIRTPQIDDIASTVAAYPSVREALVPIQRKIGESTNTVLEGRDIGTVVFPNADIKIFLTASPEVRALRRAEQNKMRHGYTTDATEVLTALLDRDKKDTSRSISPLVKADDAIEVDTSDVTIHEVVAQICEIAKGVK